MAQGAQSEAEQQLHVATNKVLVPPGQLPGPINEFPNGSMDTVSHGTVEWDEASAGRTWPGDGVAAMRAMT